MAASFSLSPLISIFPAGTAFVSSVTIAKTAACRASPTNRIPSGPKANWDTDLSSGVPVFILSVRPAVKPLVAKRATIIRLVTINLAIFNLRELWGFDWHEADTHQ